MLSPLRALPTLDLTVVIALGSNLPGVYDSSQDLLRAALAALGDVGLDIRVVSPWWRSKAWPDGTGADYVNGVALAETRLDPPSTLRALLGVEERFGRERGEANAPRTLDLDLIAHGRSRLDAPGLRLPHPRAAERYFVMGPLAAIAPEWVHPTLGQTAVALAAIASVGRDASPLPRD